MKKRINREHKSRKRQQLKRVHDIFDEFGELTAAEGHDAEHLCHSYRDQRQRHIVAQVSAGRAKERYQHLTRVATQIGLRLFVLQQRRCQPRYTGIARLSQVDRLACMARRLMCLAEANCGQTGHQSKPVRDQYVEEYGGHNGEEANESSEEGHRRTLQPDQ